MEQWTTGDKFPNNPNINPQWTIQGDYGFLHVYAFTMTLGVIVTIAISAFKFWRKGLSLRELLIGACLSVPAGLFGASFFGKLNADGYGKNANGASFFELFAFWKEGMSIHGALFLGGFVGILIFYILGRKQRVSVLVYMDCILPNILIGQAIGRWGNFYNHEIFGKPVWDVSSHSPNPLNWLPEFLRVNTQFKYTGSGGEFINGIEMINGHTYQMQPIFFYESIALFLAWIVITVFIPGIGRWISKKPWNLHPETYQLDLKYSFKHAFTWKKDAEKQTYFEVWKKAFYSNNNEQAIKKYKEEITKLQGTNSLANKWKKGKMLVDANNPDNYKIIKAGVEAGAYFFLWNLIRFVLELGRPNDHLFLIYLPTASYIAVGLTSLFGLLFMLVSQFIFPNLIRTPGYVYEKEYFYTEEIIDKMTSQESKLKKVLTKVISKKKSK